MARCLIIGCGCRGQALARELVGRGHSVRGTTRSDERFDAIAAAGAEPVLADPDRVVTLAPALAGVSVVCVLLGNAVGSEEELAALHGSRLEMLLTRIIDAPVRAFVYEGSAGSTGAAGSKGAAGAAVVSSMCERSRIPFAVVSPVDPPDVVAAVVDQLLTGPPDVTVTYAQ